MPNIRVRFAPSPTGFLHIGSLRTVLYNYLIAKKYGGTLILRVEDTDRKREVEGAAEGLVKILDWAGLHFDEGPTQGGQFGPYIQSERLDIYKKYSEELLKAGSAYRCFCTPERLEKMRTQQAEKKLPPRYDRTCRELSEAEVEKKIAAGEPYVLRQKLPLEGEIKMTDEIRGEISFEVKNLDDHVLIKQDGWPTYQFASVVDDHLMEISHVVRGDEWLSSFPKNILLYQAFGWTPPKFIHIPLVMNKEGGKLSKRQGDVAVEDFRAKGYLPEALVNFCVLLGWHPKGDVETMTLAEIVSAFEIKDIGISPAIFDIEKLDYFNGYWIRQKPLSELVGLLKPYLRDCLKDADERMKSETFLTGVAMLAQERLKKLSEICELSDFLFERTLNYAPEMLPWKKSTVEATRENLQKIAELLEKVPADEWTKHTTKESVMNYLERLELKKGDYLWPLRVALTGREQSPGPFEVAEVLGREESLKRINAAVEKL
jgi:glutamyl-tRNA synthetase